MVLEMQPNKMTNPCDRVESRDRTAIRWFNLISQHKVEEICAMTDEHWTFHGGPADLPQGPEAVRILFKRFGEVQQHWSIEDVIVEGEMVVVRAVNSCIQENFLGIPAQGKLQVFSAIFIHRIKGGKIMESWRNADDLGRLIQLGVKIQPATVPAFHGGFGFGAMHVPEQAGLKVTATPLSKTKD